MSVFITTSSNIFDLSSIRDATLPLKTGHFSKPSDNVGSCTLSVDTTVTESDDSSLSTIESTISELPARALSNNAKRRSLFPKYWTKTGASLSIPMLRKKPSSTPRMETFNVSDDSASSGHSVPATGEQASEPLSHHPATPIRRSLFSNEAHRGSSLSGLPPSCSFETPIRCNSGIELGQNAKSPVSSCLREPRFSGSRRVERRSSSICSSESSVVQFNMESTEIRHYLQPREVHAETGWTAFFH
jgi:hypothetical protein